MYCINDCVCVFCWLFDLVEHWYESCEIKRKPPSSVVGQLLSLALENTGLKKYVFGSVRCWQDQSTGFEWLTLTAVT